jgi:hypothetical protein
MSERGEICDNSRVWSQERCQVNMGHRRDGDGQAKLNNSNVRYRSVPQSATSSTILYGAA